MKNKQTLSLNQFTSGLDQLYMMPLRKFETIHDRMFAIENYIEYNGWNWDDIINGSLDDDLNIKN